jgi:hypothetical protein
MIQPRSSSKLNAFRSNKFAWGTIPEQQNNSCLTLFTPDAGVSCIAEDETPEGKQIVSRLILRRTQLRPHARIDVSIARTQPASIQLTFSRCVTTLPFHITVQCAVCISHVVRRDIDGQRQGLTMAMIGTTLGKSRSCGRKSNLRNISPFHL